MRSHLLTTIGFVLFFSFNAFGQDGKFNFTIPSTLNTSAGVFKNDSILVKTLWNNVAYNAGTYTKEWDGTDDNGNVISSPATSYKIKVLTNNVKYTWQGIIGNSSDSLTGASKHRGYYCMKGLVFASNYGYYCTGYGEGTASFYKFNIATPNQRINIFPKTTTGDVNYVATDGTTVYWGAYDAFSANNSWVFGTNVSNDSEVAFSSGSSYDVVYGRTYSKAISKVNAANSHISGLAVQKGGNYLFVARSGLNQLQVLNKTTGTVVQILNYTNVRGLSIDASDNLWMITTTNTVAKYTVNTDGTLTTATLTLSGLVSPQATQVSYNGTLISVADAGTSQQVKFFSNSTGVASNTLGTTGGYTVDANVSNNKFYFSDLRGNQLPFIAYQSDGSFWVNDPGNFRVQHYNSSNTYLNRIMSLGPTYSTWVDKNNINRVFAGYMEFSIDYSVQNLTGSTGWSLVKNWGAIVPAAYNDQTKVEAVTTLSNGRTYGTMRISNNAEIVELTPAGAIRFTGIIYSLVTYNSNMFCSDGSIQEYKESGSTATIKRFALTGFDGLNNPTWSSTGDILAIGNFNNVTGTPISTPRNEILSSNNKVVLFNPNSEANSYPVPVYTTGYHLGLMQRGASNNYLFQTEKSTHRSYQGAYPPPGWFDVGNVVNNYAGGDVNIIDRDIITSYHGEFWKLSQTNKFNHYYDNGLAIGQFGITGPEAPGQEAAAMMAGNALTPRLVKDAAGDLYLYHGDESHHSGVHRWKVTGLNTIAEQVIPIAYPSSRTVATNYVDLMAGLPFNAALVNNTAGWTRNPVVNENSAASYISNWEVNTSRASFNNLADNDVTVSCLLPSAGTNTVSRDLGVNNVSTNWKIDGSIGYALSGSNQFRGVMQQYFEVLDGNGKILISFYYNGIPSGATNIYGNGVTMASSTNRSIEKTIQYPLPFEVSVDQGVVTFKYGNYTPLTTGLSDKAANWSTPKTLRLRFVNTGAAGTGYGKDISVQNLKFYKDYSNTPLPNKPPVANADTDKTIILPTNSVSLAGSGTDSDGTIATYAWTKITGPANGTIASPALATALLNNLVQGVYLFQLIVTDNSGAIGKDTVKITVNAAANVFPSVNAGADQVITLPINSTTLSGTATDPDGTITSYSWLKISGPSLGVIVTSTLASTLVNSLVEGAYKFELTVKDNLGAIAKDTVQVTVKAAPILIPIPTLNLLPSVNPSNTVNGLDYKYYEGIWNILPAFGSLKEVKSGTTNNFDLSPASRAENYGFSFTGFIHVPSDGQYTFYTTSDDGSKLYIDDKLVVSNDGLHWAQEKSGTIGLKAGKHAINGLFFQQGGGHVFSVSYAGTGITKQEISASSLFRINALPVANAGTNQIVTLPVNSITLKGLGSDGDGFINAYAWSKISGPTAGTIVAVNSATTVVNNLVQGVYKFELTVEDNNGATAKDTLQVTVNAANNVFPSVNAGADQVISLPINSTTLSGTATDPDGSISSYSWLKISGPSSGVIVTSTLASTVVNSLVEGIYEFELTVKDNQGAIAEDTVQVTVKAVPVVNPIPMPNLLPAVNPSNTVNGLDYKYYEGTWNVLPAFGTLKEVKSGTTNNFDLSPASRAENYGFSFTGFIHVPSDGEYTFYTTSDDGSNLFIDGNLIVSNDGLHWAQERSGTIGLKAGKHAITGLFFQQGGGHVFIVSYAGKGIAKQAIPTSSLFRINNQPAARAAATQATTTETNSLILTGSATDIDGTIKSYNWKKISGAESGLLLAPGAPTTSLTNLALGSYQYQLTVKDNSGGESTDTLVVILKNAVSGEEPAFSFTETGLKTYTIFQPNNELTVFPNPVSNIAYLDIKAKNRSNQVMISVYNFAGTKVRSNQTGISSGKTQVKLDLTGLPNGIYTIVTRFDDGQVITNKILKGR